METIIGKIVKAVSVALNGALFTYLRPKVLLYGPSVTPALFPQPFQHTSEFFHQQKDLVGKYSHIKLWFKNHSNRENYPWVQWACVHAPVLQVSVICGDLTLNYNEADSVYRDPQNNGINLMH